MQSFFQRFDFSSTLCSWSDVPLSFLGGLFNCCFSSLRVCNFSNRLSYTLFWPWATSPLSVLRHHLFFIWQWNNGIVRRRRCCCGYRNEVCGMLFRRIIEINWSIIWWIGSISCILRFVKLISREKPTTGSGEGVPACDLVIGQLGKIVGHDLCL